MTLRSPGQAEQWILKLLIFLVPTNLFFHLLDSTAFIRGRLVDYLLPKVYFTDILIWILLIHFLFYYLFSIDIPSIFNYLIKHAFILLFLTYLFTIIVTSLYPIAGFSYWLRLLQMLLLAIYLYKSYSLDSFIKLAYPVIVFSLVLQSIIVWYQFIFQSPLFGFVPLGEVFSSIDPSIVSHSFFGRKILVPYGTTPHPNVVAGLYTFYTLLLFGFSKYNPNLRHIKISKYTLTGLCISIIFITQSISALSGMILCLLLFIYTSNYSLNLISRRLAVSILAVALMITFTFYHSAEMIDFYSITRRYMLIQASFQLISENVFTGVGLNNFIPAINRSSFITDSAIYLQPVHNIYLLWITETGLIGFLSLSWILFVAFSRISRISERLSLVIPVVFLMWTGIFDHYPLTLQQGLLSLTIGVAIIFLSQEVKPFS